MKKMLNTLLHPSKTKWFWVYIVLGILGIIAGIMLMPVWSGCPDWVFWKDWGMKIVNMIICVCIVLYLCLYLINKIMSRSNSVVKILTIIEFVLLALVALGCVLRQFKLMNIGNSDRYPLWWLVISICLVSFGVYLIAKPLFSDIVILWIFVVLILLVSIILLIDGPLAKPKSRKTKTKSN